MRVEVRGGGLLSWKDKIRARVRKEGSLGVRALRVGVLLNLGRREAVRDGSLVVLKVK